MEPHQASKGTHSPRVKTKVTDCSNMEEKEKGPSHSLDVLNTANTKGTNLPAFTAVFLLDGEQVMDYDSNIGKVIPKRECIKTMMKDLDAVMRTYQDHLKQCLHETVGQHNYTTGNHTMQRIYNCKLDDDGTPRGDERLILDGKALRCWNLGYQTWTAATDEAVSFKPKFERNGCTMDLQNICIPLLQNCVNFSRPTPEIPVPGGGPEGVPIDIIGGVLALVGIFAVIFYCKKKKKKKKSIIILGSDGGSGSSAV